MHGITLPMEGVLYLGFLMQRQHTQWHAQWPSSSSSSSWQNIYNYPIDDNNQQRQSFVVVVVPNTIPRSSTNNQDGDDNAETPNLWVTLIRHGLPDMIG
jgi:hypothetical protein